MLTQVVQYIKIYEFWRVQNTERFGIDKLLEHMLHIVIQRYSMDKCQNYSKIWRVNQEMKPLWLGTEWKRKWACKDGGPHKE